MSDPGRLKVDRAIVETDAAQIASASSYFSGTTLGSIDGKSTIDANGKSKGVFYSGQSNIIALGKAVDTDVINIRSLGLKFDEFDELMGELSKRGSDTT